MKDGIVTNLLEHRHDFGFLAFCLFASCIVRGMFSSGERSFKTMLVGFLCVLPVGFVAGFMAIEYLLPDSVVILIVCSVGFFGNSLLSGAVANENYFGTLIKDGAKNLIEKWTGK